MLSKNKRNDKVIKSEMVVMVDVDNTLVRDPVAGEQADLHVEHECLGGPKMVHWDHVNYVRSLHKRGFHVEVWSGNGWDWAVSVLKRIDLYDFVDQIKSKPVFFLDDRGPGGILGTGVFIETRNFFKNRDRS